ncbi:MAG: carbon-nitrogen hydrolase family protein [Planctomycetota bacterium]
MNQFAIAGIQMPVHFGHDNIPAMADQLHVLMLRFPWVEMVVFSELAAFGPSLEHAQTLPGPAETRFQELARRHRIWLIPGSIFERAGDRIYNTSPVIDPEGRVVKRYRKMFPFRPYEAGVSSGTEFCVFDVPEVGRFGLSICYDMWFPETTRTLASMGAVVLLHPSLTNTVDRDVELSIARATAAINQCYVIDVNGVGSGGYGRSIVVRPTGTVVYEAGSGAEMFPFHFNVEAATHGRSEGLFGLGQQLKSFRDRAVDFSVYRPNHESTAYLDSLGPLTVPRRGTIPPPGSPLGGSGRSVEEA